VTGARGRAGRRRRNGSQIVDGFYEEALTKAERAALPRARELQGIDEEIALVRLRLRSALEQRPKDLKLMAKGVNLLVKALSVRYRLSKDEKADLSAAIRGVLEEVGGKLYPEAIDDIPADDGF